MIARLWRARATPENAPRYRGHLEQHVLPALKKLDGYAGATLLERNNGQEVEILVITRWQTIEAIRSFAGDDLDRAVVADAAVPLLLGWDRQVRHYAVVLSDPA